MPFFLPVITPPFWSNHQGGLASKGVPDFSPQTASKLDRVLEAQLKTVPSISGIQGFQSILQNEIQNSLTSPRDKAHRPSVNQGSSTMERRSFAAAHSKAPQPSEGWVEYTIKPGDTLWDLAVNKFHVHVKDLIRDNAVQDPRRLQPGQTIRIRLSHYTGKQEVVASWYGPGYHGRAMANGKPYNMYAGTIAHRDLPLGTVVELQNQNTGEKVQAVVADRGPFIAGRDVDLSYGLAQRLSMVEKGVGNLVMRVVG